MSFFGGLSGAGLVVMSPCPAKDDTNAERKGNLEGVRTLLASRSGRRESYPASWRTRRGGREDPLGRGAEGLLGNSSLLRSEKLISY